MQRVYITLQGDNKIAIHNLNSETGELTHQEDISTPGGPAPFAVSPDNKHAYTGLRDANKMASFNIDVTSGTLKPIGTVDLESDPCYTSQSTQSTNKALSAAMQLNGSLLDTAPTVLRPTQRTHTHSCRMSTIQTLSTSTNSTIKPANSPRTRLL